MSNKLDLNNGNNIQIFLFFVLLVFNFYILEKFRKNRSDKLLFLLLIDITYFVYIYSHLRHFMKSHKKNHMHGIYLLNNRNNNRNNRNNNRNNRNNNRNTISPTIKTKPKNKKQWQLNQNIPLRDCGNDYVNLENCNSNGTCMNTPDNYVLLPQDLQNLAKKEKKNDICNYSNIQTKPICSEKKYCDCPQVGITPREKHVGKNLFGNITPNIPEGILMDGTKPLCKIGKNTTLEAFETTNQLGIHHECRKPCCPQGYIINKNGVCQQICRGCQTGICLQGECTGELCNNRLCSQTNNPQLNNSSMYKISGINR